MGKRRDVPQEYHRGKALMLLQYLYSFIVMLVIIIIIINFYLDLNRDENIL